MARRTKTLKKRFYIGSTKMLPGQPLYEQWACMDINEVIEYAKAKALKEEEDQIIVEIIRTIRFPKPVLKVEKF